MLQYAASVAIEPGGATALVGENDLYRVDLTSGAVTVVASGVASGDLAIEPGGATVLVAQHCGRFLVRVDLTDGSVTSVASDLGAPARGWRSGSVAIKEGGLSALVTQPLETYHYGDMLPQPVSGRMVRVDLVTAAVTVIVPAGLYGSGTGGIAIEAEGTALVADYRNGLVRVSVPKAP